MKNTVMPMPQPNQVPTPDTAFVADSYVAETSQFLQQVAAESIGWLPLGSGTYLHDGAGVDVPVIEVVGIADASMAANNVLLLHW